MTRLEEQCAVCVRALDQLSLAFAQGQYDAMYDHLQECAELLSRYGENDLSSKIFQRLGDEAHP